MSLLWRIVSLLILVVLVAACSSEAGDNSDSSNPQPANDATVVAALPAGDPENGAELWDQQIQAVQSCATCHSLDGSSGIGPTMQGYSEVAGTRVEGESAEVYSYHSIVNPAAYLVQGYPNVMYTQYDSALSDQQIADLIAYMLTL